MKKKTPESLEELYKEWVCELYYNLHPDSSWNDIESVRQMERKSEEGENAKNPNNEGVSVLMEEAKKLNLPPEMTQLEICSMIGLHEFSLEAEKTRKIYASIFSLSPKATWVTIQNRFNKILKKLLPPRESKLKGNTLAEKIATYNKEIADAKNGVDERLKFAKTDYYEVNHNIGEAKFLELLDYFREKYGQS